MRRLGRAVGDGGFAWFPSAAVWSRESELGTSKRRTVSRSSRAFSLRDWCGIAIGEFCAPDSGFRGRALLPKESGRMDVDKSCSMSVICTTGCPLCNIIRTKSNSMADQKVVRFSTLG